jgi:nucleoside-diphosphate-sugar epimerase
MKVVVAGGGGYIGSALLRALHQAGNETVVLTLACSSPLNEQPLMDRLGGDAIGLLTGEVDPQTVGGLLGSSGRYRSPTSAP